MAQESLKKTHLVVLESGCCSVAKVSSLGARYLWRSYSRQIGIGIWNWDWEWDWDCAPFSPLSLPINTKPLEIGGDRCVLVSPGGTSMCDWSWYGAAGQSATTEGRSVKAHRGRTDGKHRDGGGGGEPVVVRSSCVSTRGERGREGGGPARQIEAQLGKHCVAPLGALAFKL